MSFLQPLILWALPLIALPIAIHLINQWRYQTRQWAPMMFLLKATRSNRGLARLRQWLILALRTAAILGLIFAVSRPLTSGFWSNFAGGRADTMIVLMDRSPSMRSELANANRHLASAFATLEASHWVAVDSNTAKATEFPNYDALLDSAVVAPSSATSRIPLMVQAALDYIQTNKPGSADIWICSDLQTGDWNPESGVWKGIQSGLESFPQSVRIHLLAHADSTSDNLAIRVTRARRQVVAEGRGRQNKLFLSLQVFSTGRRGATDSPADDAMRTVPVQFEIDGVRTELQVELRNGFAELIDTAIALPAKLESGWGRVLLPADANNRDNEFFFVFDQTPAQRVILVADDPNEMRPLEIVSGISTDPGVQTQVEVLAPNQVDTALLQNTSLLIWQADLPDDALRGAIDGFISQGGQVLFFPPKSLRSSTSGALRPFKGVRWNSWKPHGDAPLNVAAWRGDQDLLAATNSGAGLPVAQLKVFEHATLVSDQPMTSLATLDGGDSLLVQLPTTSGGVYFFTSGTDPKHSTLAEEGVVLFVMIQRAIKQGQLALQGSKMRDAGGGVRPADGEPARQGEGENAITGQWTQIAGAETLSSEYEFQAGVYRSGNQMFAVNRPASEDSSELLTNEKLDSLFEGTPIHRIDTSDSGGSIIREVWRPVLMAVLIALVLESLLSLPRTLKTQ